MSEYSLAIQKGFHFRKRMALFLEVEKGVKRGKKG
jgi:hypothetical protein